MLYTILLGPVSVHWVAIDEFHSPLLTHPKISKLTQDADHLASSMEEGMERVEWGYFFLYLK